MFVNRRRRFTSAGLDEMFSRGHGYSDSQSSLASITTSRSGAHSRISSVTTINEIPSIDSFLTEISRVDAHGLRSPSALSSMTERREVESSCGKEPVAGFAVTTSSSFARPASPSDAVLGMGDRDRLGLGSTTMAK